MGDDLRRGPGAMVKQEAWDPPPESLSLPGDAVHVWRADLDRGATGGDRWWRLLSPHEQERAARFHFERHRQRFVTGRGLLRLTLARYLGCAPQAIRFDYGPQGKPRLGGEFQGAGLRFNVSHSAGLALFAVARGRAVGVDVECCRRLEDAVQIARRFFSPPEVAAVLAAGEREQTARFFQIWTRKEAYIKATGKGLSQPLADFDVVDEAGAPTPYVRLRRGNGATRWRLLDLAPHPGYAAALAVEGDGWRLRCWQTTGR